MLRLFLHFLIFLSFFYTIRKKEERKELEQEYENLKLLASFHEAYGVPENEKEREALINDILDRMNEIREKLKE